MTVIVPPVNAPPPPPPLAKPPVLLPLLPPPPHACTLILVTPAGTVKLKVPTVLKVCEPCAKLSLTKNKFAITNAIAITKGLRKNFFILL
jgi:hypothetical protein